MIFKAASTNLIDTLAAQVCIIGAGAAGITLACEFDACGFAVLLLEAGGFRPDADTAKALFFGSAGTNHPPPTEYRRCGFGGTTSVWGGRCVPYDRIDFEKRAHIPNSGWPISYDEVARHYPKAVRYCEAGTNDFSVKGSIEGAKPTLAGLEKENSLDQDRIERYSLPTNFGKSYYRKIANSKNVTAVLGLRCLGLKRDPGSRTISAAEFVDQAGERVHVRAQVFIVAAGGIESTRLLMASDAESGGLGNASGALGRYYGCHFENFSARLDSNKAPVAFSFEKTRDGVFARRQMRISDGAQRTHRLANGVFRLHFPSYADASHRSGVLSMIYLMKSAIMPEYRNILGFSDGQTGTSSHLAHARNVCVGLPQILKFGCERLRSTVAHRKLPYTLVASSRGSYPLEFNSEQIPYERSRITLGNEADRFGSRGVHIDWRVCEEDVSAAKRAYHFLRRLINRTSAYRLEFDEGRLTDALRNPVPVGGHHIGTTRMSATEKTGVVDANCAVHGLANLFVASASVFPTTSHANPTLTIVAMAIRLAGHVKAQLRPAIIELY